MKPNGEVRSYLLSDWAVNKERPEIQILLLLFRIAQLGKRLPFAGRAARLVSIPFVLPYLLYSRFGLSFDVPPSTQLGPRCRVYHAHGIVINASTIIGSDVVLRHGTTLGSRVSGSDAPKIGSNVEMGANVMVLGDVKIGDGSVIGAGSLVLEDLAPNSVTVAGSKARTLNKRREDSIAATIPQGDQNG
ncbi:serine acetyltransferase [Arthrobacter sp. CC3]|uniref:serine O-acetyltransferase n=1 Tax=Arthrobacter sp. CC3 TaxID=3029185 RepID=UPI0032636BDD